MNSFTRAPFAPGVSVAGMIWSIMATTVSFKWPLSVRRL